MKKVYKKVNETDSFYGKSAERTEVCSLKNAINVNVNGKLFCLAHVGQTKHKEAFQLCQSLNARLPLPKSIVEYYHFIESFKRLGIDKKMNDFSAKIVLNARRQLKKGEVSSFLVSISC